MSRYLGFKAVESGKYYFVSYNSNDEERVSKYAVAMNNAGVPMWYDDGIKIGEEWEKQIADKIQGCCAVIMFLSKNTFEKEKSYIKKEYKIAYRYDKQIYTIMLDDIKDEDVPNRFLGWWYDIIDYQAVRACDMDDIDKCVDEIVERVKNIDSASDIYDEVIKETESKQNESIKQNENELKRTMINVLSDYCMKKRSETNPVNLKRRIAEIPEEELRLAIKELLNKQNIVDSSKYLLLGTEAFNRKIYKAIRSYASVSSNERVLLMFDDTIFGSATEGFVLTDKNIYLKSAFEKKCFPLADIVSVVTENPVFGCVDLCAVSIEGHYKLSIVNINEETQHVGFIVELLKYIKQNDSFVGKKEYSNGDVYEGEIWCDQPHGKGIYSYANGEIYDGDFVCGKFHGIGKYTYPDGESYEGSFKNDKIHGFGKYVFADGRVFEGEFVTGKRHGTGKMTYPEGDVYIGSYLDDKRHGNGKYDFGNGETYEGKWKNDVFHGNGKRVYADGNVYEGEWQNGKRNGKGTCRNSNGSIYEGEWLDDKIHGNGKFTFVGGSVYEGAFIDNQFHGYGVLTFVNGDKYEGEWLEGQRSQGKMSYANGDVYEGFWSENKRCGEGKMTYANGDVYVGEFKNDMQDGKGTYTKIISGIWKNGKFIG